MLLGLQMATTGRWRVPLWALRSFPRVNLTNLQPFPGTRKTVCRRKDSLRPYIHSTSVLGDFGPRTYVLVQFGPWSFRSSVTSVLEREPNWRGEIGPCVSHIIAIIFRMHGHQAHLDIRIFLPSELLMRWIDCLSHYCTVACYKHLKTDLTVI